MYSEKEKSFIETSLSQTNERDPSIEDELVITKSEDILYALNYRHDKLGGIGKKHSLLFSIFEKLGYSHDGKTTLKEIAEREQARKDKILQLQASRKRTLIADLEEQRRLAQIKIEQLNRSEEDLTAEIDAIKAKSADELKRKVADLKKAKLAELGAQSDEIIADMNEQIKESEKEEEIDYGTLTIPEMEKLYTLKELKEIAANLKIEHPIKIIKKDLIKLIQEA